MLEPMLSVLFVEDDDKLREATQAALERDGFDVEVAPDGAAGLEAFERRRPDLALLDVMLPRMDGVTLCREIRARSAIPIVLLSARSDPIDVVVGLEAGADDYVIKPFDTPVLSARLRAVARRAQRLLNASVIRVANLEIDEDAMTVLCRGEPRAPHGDGVPAPGRPGAQRGSGTHPPAVARGCLGIFVGRGYTPCRCPRAATAREARLRAHRDRAGRRLQAQTPVNSLFVRLSAAFASLLPLPAC